jgi:hypothetical protein
MLAVVAHQPFGRAMVGERDRTLRAGRDIAARLALHERRVSAAVEEHDALLAVREGLAKRGFERCADHRRELISGHRRRERRRGRSAAPPQIDDFHRGQPAASDAIGERQQAVLARCGIGPRLQTRRRTPEDRERAGVPRPYDRDYARMVSR